MKGKATHSRRCYVLSFLCLCVGLSALPLLAEDSPQASPSAPLADTKTSTETGAESTSTLSQYWLMPQVSVVMPTSLILTNKDFRVPYHRQFPSLSQFGVALITPIKKEYEELELLGVAKLGLSYKEGNYQFARTNGEVVNGKAKLFWMPMSVGGKVQYSIPGFPHVKPSVTLGGGMNWLYQSGSLSGMNSSFWMPFFYLTPALSFFEGRNTDDWFGGFTFGVTYQSSFSSAQTVRGWSFDMGLNIIL